VEEAKSIDSTIRAGCTTFDQFASLSVLRLTQTHVRIRLLHLPCDRLLLRNLIFFAVWNRRVGAMYILAACSNLVEREFYRRVR
jgi:hypothetical protein